MLLSIIIVSFNTQELTIQAINSVFDQFKQAKKLAHDSEIIVVDNHSTDGSIEAIKQVLKNSPIKQQLIINQDNLGFAKANNQAIRKASGQYILLLNSDTKLQKNCLLQLLTTFDQHKDNELTASLASEQNKIDRLSIVSAMLLNADGSIQPQGGAYPNLLSVFCQMFFLDDLPIIGRLFPSTQHTGLNSRWRYQQQTPIKQAWVAGTAMLIKKSVLDKIGLLDENIFMYGEDMELCLRASNHHYDVVINPLAKVTHYGSASSSSANAIVGEVNGLIYLWGKHKAHWQLPILKTILQIACLLRIVLFTLLGKTDKAKIYQLALRQIK